MSTHDTHDQETTGYFLPEDSQRRLKQLHTDVAELANLARPQKRVDTAEGDAARRLGEVARRLRQMKQQMAQVMETLAWPARRGKDAVASGMERDAHGAPDEASEAGIEAGGAIHPATGKRYLSGITLRQIDEINLLLESLRAIGNVVGCADHAEYAEATLAVMGDAISRDVGRIHDIVEEIYASQRFSPKRTLGSVREAPASYLVPPAPVPAGIAPRLSQSHPTYQ
ncbi:hypothetical protein [Pseudoxanthomonas sp. JBR18]|uniref:XAC0095 family protein n=1 Tax=Pseudoxanthomonas sp. JBR18 TaxID=2969308 RepID=UPI0023060F6D|nr:hypothetical protein [Pseudoxanthomonas sp. JBR18]WCE05899.1 hypothetical protein PJ250_08100 [Pseudoxanthomonas sp. JBR18]